MGPPRFRCATLMLFVSSQNKIEVFKWGLSNGCDKAVGFELWFLELKATMASIPCILQQTLTPSRPVNSSRSATTLCKLTSPFVGFPSARSKARLGWCRPTRIGPCSNGSRTTCWFRFGKNGVDAEGAGIYGSQSRDDFDKEDVEQYFNYMGMLAVEGTYDKMYELLSQNIHPVDILLMMAASEGDKPKIEELLRAGADYTVKDSEGLTALDKAANDVIKDFILGFSVQKA